MPLLDVRMRLRMQEVLALESSQRDAQADLP